MLRDYIIAFMDEFHSTDKLSKGLGASFIALIPKRTDDISVSKIIAPSFLAEVFTRFKLRFLAGKLQKFFPCIISKVQGAFGQGEADSMQDSVANECLHSRNRDMLPVLILKLDLEKSCDRVDLGSLDAQ